MFFVVTVVTFTVAGAAWGALYPATQVQILDDLSMEIVTGTEDSGFTAYVWFIAVTVVLGFGLSQWAFRTLRRSAGQLFWVFVWVLFGSWWFVFIGNQLASVLQGDRPEANPGTVFEIIHYVSAWPGVLLAPTIAVLVYWIGAVISDPDWFDNER